MIIVFKSDVSVSKINFIKALTPCLKTMNHKQLSFLEPLELSFRWHELMKDKSRIWEYIDYMIIVDEVILEIIDDENQSYQGKFRIMECIDY